MPTQYQTNSNNTNYKDPLIFSEFRRFVNSRKKHLSKLTSKEESEEFQHFVTLQVLRRWFLPDVEQEDAGDTIVDGSDDNQTDSIAIIVNDHLVIDQTTLENALEEPENLSVRIVMIQVTRAHQFATVKMNTFVDGCEHFLADRAMLHENNEITRLRSIKDRIFEVVDQIGDTTSVEIFLYYCNLGKWTQSNKQERWRDWNYTKIKNRCPNADVELETVDYPRLTEYLRQNANSPTIERETIELYSEKVITPHLVPVNNVSNARALIGYLDASEYVKFLEREDGQGIDERVFNENVRGFNGTANPVNRAIAETLKGAAPNQFPLLNNGVTLVAPRAEYDGHTLTLNNYQIVNGMQTSYTLYRNRLRLANANVSVPIKIVESTDPKLINEIIIGTNAQTSIGRVQFHSREAIVRDLVDFFAEAGAANPSLFLHLERRRGEFDTETPDHDAERIITLEELIKAAGSLLLNSPHFSHKGISKLLPKIPHELLRQDHHLEPYFCAAFLIYRVNRNLENTHRYKHLKIFRYHLVNLAGIGLASAPMPDNHLLSSNGKTFWQQVMKAIESDQHVDDMIELAYKTIDARRLEIKQNLRKNSPQWASMTKSTSSAMYTDSRQLES